MQKPQVQMIFLFYLEEYICIFCTIFSLFLADFPSNKKTLIREMALLKIVSSKTNLEKSKKLCKKYKVTIIDKTSKSLVLEISALKKEIDQLLK